MIAVWLEDWEEQTEVQEDGAMDIDRYGNGECWMLIASKMHCCERARILAWRQSLCMQLGK